MVFLIVLLSVIVFYLKTSIYCLCLDRILFGFSPLDKGAVFGGALAWDKDIYKTVNGYSNLFFGWGGEDDDLYAR